jgi:hypothetical protein
MKRVRMPSPHVGSLGRTLGVSLLGALALTLTAFLTALGSDTPRDPHLATNAREARGAESRGASSRLVDTNAALRSREAPADRPSPDRRFEGDPHEITRAIDDAVTRRDARLETLSALAAVPLDQDGYVAAAAIRALGDLATEADSTGKALALRTLTTHLARERQRAATDTLARGNVSLLVDALADTGDPAAVAALGEALDTGSLPLHQETRVVEALTALGDPNGLRAIERFRSRLERESPRDPAEVELHREALAAAAHARISLGG